MSFKYTNPANPVRNFSKQSYGPSLSGIDLGIQTNVHQYICFHKMCFHKMC